MSNMDTTTYIGERLSPQIRWYDGQSQHAKRMHEALSLIIVVLLTAIPVSLAITAVAESTIAIPLAAALSGTAMALFGIGLFMRYPERWIRYRIIAEELKRQRIFVELHHGPYRGLTDHDALDRLVQQVESIISIHAGPVATGPPLHATQSRRAGRRHEPD